MIQICGHAEVINTDNYVMETRKLAQNLKKHHFRAFQKYQLVLLFQNEKGETFACGNNHLGQCGLGHYNHPQITPSLILNLPSNIVQFVCGSAQNLFLDSEGNVFSVGSNSHGALGLGHNRSQNVLNKIPNIPPIKIISCVNASSYLIDFEGNLWSFGFNGYGQLGHGDNTHKNVPIQISNLKDIQQVMDLVGSIFWPKTFKIKYS